MGENSAVAAVDSVPLHEVGWILFRSDLSRFVAHCAICDPAGTRFVPIFKTRRDAMEYRDLRLKVKNLKPKRVRVEGA